jgi:hypothetical protein
MGKRSALRRPHRMTGIAQASARRFFYGILFQFIIFDPSPRGGRYNVRTPHADRLRWQLRHGAVRREKQDRVELPGRPMRYN